MIGQAVSLQHKKYNIIILAAGAGSRMGISSEYIPKALSKIGNNRAIDHIIERYIHVAHKYIIGIGYHADLLQLYIKGAYPNICIDFSIENPSDIKNNAISAAYCLDHADSRYGTIIIFCDLLIVNNIVLNDDSIYLANNKTIGNIGSFRHSVNVVNDKIEKFIEHDEPKNITEIDNGVLGTFSFSDTVLLKSITYQNFNILKDLTYNIVSKYSEIKSMNVVNCECVYEFGNENDLEKVRKMWEQG